MSDLERLLRARAHEKCELCGAGSALQVQAVPPTSPVEADRSVLVCATCARQTLGEAALEEAHWFCLREAAWSEVAAVQVASLRMLKRLGAAWALELLAQVYVDEDRQAWVDAGAASSEGDREAPTLDSNGAPLAEGDSVTLIKDLDVKGGGFVAKRGTVVRGIRLTGDPENIEGKVNGSTLVLKTRFLKKA